MIKTPNKNTLHQIGEGVKIQHYTNGSFAYWNGASWINIPKDLGERLYNMRYKLTPIADTSINDNVEIQ